MAKFGNYRTKSGKKVNLNLHKKTLFCSGQKAVSKIYDEKYQEIFGKETFDKNLIKKD